MSIAVLAQHMAEKGRHGDDMLVHMSKDEVAALQQLAEAHGLTLTINPETGLPEAFSLKSLLSAVAPLALGWALGPAGFGLFGSSLTASLAVGGIGALATGSLEKGLQMGLSAYGGSELGTALKAAGAAATAPVASAADAAAQNAITSPQLGRQLSQSQMAFLEANAPEVAAAQQAAALAPVPEAAFTPSVENMLNPSTGRAMLSPQETFSQLPVSDQISNIYKGVSANPGQFLKSNWQPLAMAGMPLLTAMGPSGIKGVSTETDPSKVYFPRKRFNPYTGTYEQLPGFTLADYRSGIMSGRNPMTAADGGIVALADGGVTPSYQRTSMSPGMLDFADKSEPVVRMADGGATREEVLNAYRNTAGAVTNPDEAAINYWMGQGLGGFANAVSGARAGMSQDQLGAIDAARTAGTGVLNQNTFNQMVAAAPAAQNVTTQTATAAPTQANLNDITNIYRNVLGRDPDAVGLNYWAGRLAGGESLDSVYSALQGSARTVLGANASTLAPGLGKTLADATKAYTGYTSGAGGTIGDEWIRNTLGREPTAADKAQGWYQSLDKLGTQADVTKAYADFLAYAGKSATGQPDWFTASQLKAPKASPTITGGGGNDIIRVEQPPGTGTPPIQQVIPGKNVPTMTDVRNAYTQGGGNIYAPKYPKKYKGTSGTVGGVDLITQGYQDFWANTPVGSEISWAGGKLKRVGGGKAVFTGPDGNTYELAPGSDLNNIAANNPYIAETWRKEFGFIPTNYVTGATLKGYNYLMGQGEYPVSQAPADKLMKPYFTDKKYEQKVLGPTDGGTKIDTSNINPNAPAGMQAAYDGWWANSKVGESVNWAGGTLTRTAAGTSVFKYKDENGKDQQMVLAPNSLFETLATNPLIAKYWATEFGYDPVKHKNPSKETDTGGGGGVGEKAGGLLSLAQGGEAEGSWERVSGGEGGDYVFVPAPTPVDQGIATLAPATPPAAPVAAPVDQGLATLTTSGAQQNAALQAAGYNPQTDTTAPAKDWTAEDYARIRYRDMFGREGTPEDIAAVARNIIVDPSKNYATYRYYTPFGNVDTAAFRTPMETAKVVNASVFPGAAEDQSSLPHMYRNEGQVLGKDGNMYKVMEHGELLQQKLTSDQRNYMAEQAAQDQARLGPWERGAATIGPVNWSLSDYVNKPAVAAPVAQMTQEQKQALAQQIVQLGYDPTGRYDPAVMAIVAKLKGTGMASGGMSKMAQLSMMGGAAAGGKFDLGDYSDGGRLLKGPGDGVSDSIPASIGNKRPARLADGEFVVPARIVSELGNGSTDAGARKLYAMMDRIQARRSKTTGKGKVAVNSRADKYLPA